MPTLSCISSCKSCCTLYGFSLPRFSSMKASARRTASSICSFDTWPAPCSFAHLAADAPGDVIARQQLRGPAGVLALELLADAVEEALLRVVGRLRLVVVGDVPEHEALALAVGQDAALAAHALRHQDAADAW